MAREGDKRAHQGLARVESRIGELPAAPEGAPKTLVASTEGIFAAPAASQHRRSPADPKTLPAAGVSVKPAAPHNRDPATPPYNRFIRADRRSGPKWRPPGRSVAQNPEPPAHPTDSSLATFKEISAFLAAVERRAFKQASFALRDDHSALDVVQDAMLKLTEKYSDKPAAELPLLFQRILQNTIHDHFRRQKVRTTWTTVLSALGRGDEKDDEFDPLETLRAKSDSNANADPAEQLEQAQIMRTIEQALTRLPARQREAFLLRYWEELDVAETAVAMGCSEGSVKTHCSRAVHALAEMLRAKGVKP